MLDRILDVVADHTAALFAGGASVAGAVALSTGAVQGSPFGEWTPFLILVGPPLAVFGTKLLGAFAKARRKVSDRQRERELVLRAKADKLENDGNDANDAEAKQLLLEADKLRDKADFNEALAEGLGALSSKKKDQE